MNSKNAWVMQQVLGLRPMPDGSEQATGAFDGGAQPRPIEEQATAATRELNAFREAGLLPRSAS